jgi:hypothetical protein
MDKEPLFYAEGDRIFQRPVETVRPDGTRATTMGFCLCTVSEYLNEGAAQKIVDMLNAGHEAQEAAAKPQDDEALTVQDYKEVLADKRRLTRELDVLLNGAGAAPQASLCDIVSQVEREGIRAKGYIAPEAEGGHA